MNLKMKLFLWLTFMPKSKDFVEVAVKYEISKVANDEANYEMENAKSDEEVGCVYCYFLLYSGFEMVLP